MLVKALLMLVSGAWALEPPSTLLLDYNKMRVSKQDFVCLAQNAYFEARSDKPETQIAITHVVLNRVKQTKKGICQVVHRVNPSGRNCSFSWYCDRRSDIPVDVRAWIRACAIVAVLLEYNLPDPTNGAMFYTEKSIRPAWSKGMTVTATIGMHRFYR
jgi:spore germination cell wall hydrolase CwlJ-like protein